MEALVHLYKLHKLVRVGSVQQDPHERLRDKLLIWHRGKMEATAGLQRAQAHLKRHDPDVAIEVCACVRIGSLYNRTPVPHTATGSVPILESCSPRVRLCSC